MCVCPHRRGTSTGQVCTQNIAFSFSLSLSLHPSCSYRHILSTIYSFFFSILFYFLNFDFVLLSFSSQECSSHAFSHFLLKWYYSSSHTVSSSQAHCYIHTPFHYLFKIRTQRLLSINLIHLTHTRMHTELATYRFLMRKLPDHDAYRALLKFIRAWAKRIAILISFSRLLRLPFALLAKLSFTSVVSLTTLPPSHTIQDVGFTAPAVAI